MDPRVLSGADARSTMSGKEPNLIVRGCDPKPETRNPKNQGLNPKFQA